MNNEETDALDDMFTEFYRHYLKSYDVDEGTAQIAARNLVLRTAGPIRFRKWKVERIMSKAKVNESGEVVIGSQAKSEFLEVEFLDLKTGETKSTNGLSRQEVETGRWTCDCKRYSVFELEKAGGCTACRFIATAVFRSRETEGNSTTLEIHPEQAEILREANLRYWARFR